MPVTILFSVHVPLARSVYDFCSPRCLFSSRHTAVSSVSVTTRRQLPAVTVAASSVGGVNINVYNITFDPHSNINPPPALSIRLVQQLNAAVSSSFGREQLSVCYYEVSTFRPRLVVRPFTYSPVSPDTNATDRHIPMQNCRSERTHRSP